MQVNKDISWLSCQSIWHIGTYLIKCENMIRRKKYVKYHALLFNAVMY